jgi:hypothetical protein
MKKQKLSARARCLAEWRGMRPNTDTAGLDSAQSLAQLVPKLIRKLAKETDNPAPE